MATIISFPRPLKYLKYPFQVVLLCHFYKGITQIGQCFGRSGRGGQQVALLAFLGSSPAPPSPPMACGFPWVALGMGGLRPEDPVPLKANFPSLSTLSTPLYGLSTLSTRFRLCSCAIFTRASLKLASVSAAQAAGASKLRCSHSLDPRLPPHRRPWRVGVGCPRRTPFQPWLTLINLDQPK